MRQLIQEIFIDNFAGGGGRPLGSSWRLVGVRGGMVNVADLWKVIRSGEFDAAYPVCELVQAQNED